MGTTANRPKYRRDKRRHPSDLTGDEWAYIELPGPNMMTGSARSVCAKW